MRATLWFVWVFAWCVTAAKHHKVFVPRESDLPPTCDSLVYCQGDLLHTVQMSKFEEDSKLFVDRSMINDVKTTLANFEQMMANTNRNPSRDQIEAFVNENFISENELDDWTPPDFVEEPAFLAKIGDEEVRTFAKSIVSIWKDLGRTIRAEVKENPEQHSLIYVPNGFIIPGGRFREYYYWDSYWIIEGLLVSEMTDTVRGMIENLLSIVDRYGHVPNGGRVYYIQRSQPPLLSQMARRYYEETGDIDWLKSNIDLLTKEVQFWIENRMVSTEVNGEEYQVAVYHARSAGPRPESYYEDYTTAGIYDDEDDKNELYIQLKTTAESGWDFSSRWIFDENGGMNANISFTNTSRVAPVDLNSYLYQSFCNIAMFYKDLNDVDKQFEWETRAANLNESIAAVLWNEEDGIWYDFDLDLLKPRKQFASSNLTPLWVKAYNTESDAADVLINRVVNYLKRESITEFLGGIPATLRNTREQWDFPNAWPHLQTIIINGLEDSGVEEGKRLAREFAANWIRANMIGFNNTGYMFEKYDAENPGAYGGGGEYNVQKGFGWANGAALELIKKYYSV